MKGRTISQIRPDTQYSPYLCGILRIIFTWKLYIVGFNWWKKVIDDLGNCINMLTLLSNIWKGFIRILDVYYYNAH